MYQSDSRKCRQKASFQHKTKCKAFMTRITIDYFAIYLQMIFSNNIRLPQRGCFRIAFFLVGFSIAEWMNEYHQFRIPSNWKCEFLKANYVCIDWLIFVSIAQNLVSTLHSVCKLFKISKQMPWNKPEIIKSKCQEDEEERILRRVRNSKLKTIKILVLHIKHWSNCHSLHRLHQSTFIIQQLKTFKQTLLFF